MNERATHELPRGKFVNLALPNRNLPVRITSGKDIQFCFKLRAIWPARDPPAVEIQANNDYVVKNLGTVQCHRDFKGTHNE